MLSLPVDTHGVPSRASCCRATPRNATRGVWRCAGAQGADRFIDYTKHANVFDAVADDTLDAVYDNYGAPGTADQAMPALRAGGTFIFLPGNGGALAKKPKRGVKQLNFGMVDSTNYRDLDALKALADAGTLKPHLQAVFALADLRLAFNLSMSGAVQGKIGILIPGPPPPPPPPSPAEQCLALETPDACNAKPSCWWFTSGDGCDYCPPKAECKTFGTEADCTADPYCQWTSAGKCVWPDASCPTSRAAGNRA